MEQLMTMLFSPYFLPIWSVKMPRLFTWFQILLPEAIKKKGVATQCIIHSPLANAPMLSELTFK